MLSGRNIEHWTRRAACDEGTITCVIKTSYNTAIEKFNGFSSIGMGVFVRSYLDLEGSVEVQWLTHIVLLRSDDI